MSSLITRRIAAVALGLNAAVHLILVPEYLAEMAYIGVSFIALAAISTWVAVRVLSDDRRAWMIGALASAGAFLGFIGSRTTGLPGFHPTDWELIGLVTLLLEAIVVGTYLLRSKDVA